MWFGQKVQALSRSIRITPASAIESIAAGAFYLGLVAMLYGLVRVTTASIERRGRDLIGIIALAVGGVLFVICVFAYLHSPKSVLPF